MLEENSYVTTIANVSDIIGNVRPTESHFNYILKPYPCLGHLFTI